MNTLLKVVYSTIQANNLSKQKSKAYIYRYTQLLVISTYMHAILKL